MQPPNRLTAIAVGGAAIAVAAAVTLGAMDGTTSGWLAVVQAVTTVVLAAATVIYVALTQRLVAAQTAQLEQARNQAEVEYLHGALAYIVREVSSGLADAARVLNYPIGTGPPPADLNEPLGEWAEKLDGYSAELLLHAARLPGAPRKAVTDAGLACRTAATQLYAVGAAVLEVHTAVMRSAITREELESLDEWEGDWRDVRDAYGGGDHPALAWKQATSGTSLQDARDRLEEAERLLKDESRRRAAGVSNGCGSAPD